MFCDCMKKIIFDFSHLLAKGVQVSLENKAGCENMSLDLSHL